jgi:L-ascorbate metabolism protein UlaG (beta-lactamase superfamily)
VGDTVDIAKTNGATVITNYELVMWLVSKGLEKFNPMNTGGTTDLGGLLELDTVIPCHYGSFPIIEVNRQVHRSDVGTRHQSARAGEARRRACKAALQGTKERA